MDSSDSSSEGLVLLNSSLDPVYANSEAVKILFYPNNFQKITALGGLLAERVRSVLLQKGRSPQLSFVSELRSGRRQYKCRSFFLESQSDKSGESRFALLIERGRPKSLSRDFHAFEKFKLTKREREVVIALVEGLTTKEIAKRMELSPNTVKAFLRRIMLKMGVTTRSGIVGALFSTTGR